jgi:[ribosomal protein S5]-alanine N-acetyltransferase
MMATPEILETERLLLKGYSPAGMYDIFENLSKPEIMQLLGHRSEESYLKELYKHKNGYSSYNRSFMLFLLIEKASGEIIGRCGLHNWSVDDRRAEIGYVMEADDYKRKGFMTEAVQAILDYGFNTLHLNRIEALVAAGNVASLGVLKKFHFEQEGVLRQHCYSNEAWEDSILFSKLRATSSK